MAGGIEELPHPLFCAPCPFTAAEMGACEGYEPEPRTTLVRTAVGCRHFVVEQTPAGPVPGCTRHREDEQRS